MKKCTKVLPRHYNMDQGGNSAKQGVSYVQAAGGSLPKIWAQPVYTPSSSNFQNFVELSFQILNLNL